MNVYWAVDHLLALCALIRLPIDYSGKFGSNSKLHWIRHSYFAISNWTLANDLLWSVDKNKITSNIWFVLPQQQFSAFKWITNEMFICFGQWMRTKWFFSFFLRSFNFNWNSWLCSFSCCEYNLFHFCYVSNKDVIRKRTMTFQLITLMEIICLLKELNCSFFFWKKKLFPQIEMNKITVELSFNNDPIQNEYDEDKIKMFKFVVKSNCLLCSCFSRFLAVLH